MSLSSITYDLSASGGPKRITAEELTRLAVRAKSKVKATARGWSMLSQHEVLALAWFADLLLEDGELVTPPPAKPEPAVISNV
ncbi:hypothetical protein AIOL_000927 [Candidatus Rhodobacter oscarellae]|uniref:Uncharacterized protein n=1 Tax=Candidatus Rhodobacter oscarellae TaxID=1675527 RepID=A0A0J9ED75_9RHOB|nr:hypothetical protein [Candidatus Rhodobacter lobularis]KMW60762.1 hypothetical protein AIOL_000927 [Candidatus Rhodobacter lobularis]